ncbi:MAG: hypothetical protein HYT70_00595 [Candidatus Aenigmarchaeota archaeon]|nr:hypothetical protein [Candidatus Aenigmarchaeota archaeon]
MRKGIAVPYIIAILLGIAVIGLIGYWLFVSGGRIGISSAELQCNNQVIRYCDQQARATPAGSTPDLNGWIETAECKTAFPDRKYQALSADECADLGVSTGLKAAGASCAANSECASGSCVSTRCA